MNAAGVFDVIVVGGGVSGITAAVRLSAAGRRVMLLEKRAYLGGRASSFLDQHTHTLIDHSQHVMLECCTEFDTLLRALNVSHHIRFLDQIHYLLPDGSQAALSACALPVPYHLLPSLLMMRGLGMRDILSVNRLLKAARSSLDLAEAGSAGGNEESTFDDLCRQARLTPSARRIIVEPLIFSACNAPIEEVSAKYGAMAISDGIMAGRRAYRIGVPRVPLAELFTDPTIELLRRNGSDARLQTNVVSMERTGPGVRVRDIAGRSWAANACVLALPYGRLVRLAPDRVLTSQQASVAERLVPSPIVAAHLWFDEDLPLPEATCLPGRATHWIFHRTCAPNAHCAAGSYITTVTSGDRSLASLSGSRILEIVLRDLQAALGTTMSIRPVHHRVVRERSATFVPAPGVDRFRPAVHTRYPEFVVAGDWTDTGWPATMEGAARSGRSAAAALLASLR